MKIQALMAALLVTVAVTRVAAAPPAGGLAPTVVVCPVERAHYVLRQAPDYTADFEPRRPTPDWPANVQFAIHSSKTGMTYFFLPYSGNGQGVTTHFASVDDPAQPPGPDGPSKTRPLGDLDYIAADPTYAFDQGFWAHAGAPAPAHLFIPGLQAAFWYRTDPYRREGVPLAFFDFMSCRP